MYLEFLGNALYRADSIDEIRWDFLAASEHWKLSRNTARMEDQSREKLQW